MEVFRTIIKYEWLQLSRSRAFWILTVIFSLISVYAAFYGKSEVREQQQKIALLDEVVHNDMMALRQDIAQHDTVAWAATPLYKTTFYNKPDGLAALAFGQRDLHKFAIQISEDSYFYNKYATGYTNKTLSGEIANPQKQLAGHLDLSFVLVFLLPLYFILLSYNLLSSEKEQGTLSLLTIQPVSLRKVFFAKLFLRWLVTVMLAVVLLLMAAAVNGALTDGRIFLFALTIILYIVVWAGIAGVMTSFGKSSGFNALGLVVVWLFFTTVLPAAFSSLLEVKQPSKGRIALAFAVQKANAEVFDLPYREVTDEFFKIHPAYRDTPTKDLPGDKWINPLWMRAIHTVTDNRIEQVEKPYFTNLTHRLHTSGRFNYLSPALLSGEIFTTLTASDLGQMYTFDKATWDNFKSWNAYLDNLTFFNGNRMGIADFDKLPQFTFNPVINYKKTAFMLVILFFWGSLLMGVTYKGFRWENKNKQ